MPWRCGLHSISHMNFANTVMMVSSKAFVAWLDCSHRLCSVGLVQLLPDKLLVHLASQACKPRSKVRVA